MPARHREVVHDGRAGPFDHVAVDQASLPVGNVIRQVRLHPQCAEEDQLAGLGIDLRVSRHVRLQSAAEAVHVDGVQLRIDFVGEVHFLQCQDATGVRHHIGTCGAGREVDRPIGAEQRSAVQGRRVDPAVAIPLGSAAMQAHAVHHAAAFEPEVGRDAGPGVVAISQVHARQGRRHRTPYTQWARGGPLEHGPVVALQEHGGLGTCLCRRRTGSRGTGDPAGAGGACECGQCALAQQLTAHRRLDAILGKSGLHERISKGWMGLSRIQRALRGFKTRRARCQAAASSSAALPTCRARSADRPGPSAAAASNTWAT